MKDVIRSGRSRRAPGAVLGALALGIGSGAALAATGSYSLSSVWLATATTPATTATTATAQATQVSTRSTLKFSASTYSMSQSAGTVSLSVTRTGSTQAAVSIAYATKDGSAKAGKDYTAKSGTLSWAAGSAASESIKIPVSTAVSFAGSKSFIVALSNPTGRATIGNPGAAFITVVGGGSTVTPPPVTPPPPVSPSGTFGIKVSGNKFVSTKDGSPVQIVGANMSGMETGYAGARWTAFQNAGSAFWKKVVNWGGAGVNTVRIPLNEASWLNYTCYDSGSGASSAFYQSAGNGAFTPDKQGIYQAAVKQAVADATAAGLYVILDLHWGAPNNASGQPLCPIGQPGYADADHSVTFWKQIADTFKNNPAVIFELFNEPYGTNNYGKGVVQNGNTFTPGPEAKMLATGGSFSPLIAQNNANNNAMVTTNITWNVASMITLLNTIRGEGATNVVLASPIGWAGEIETWLGTYTANGNPDPLKQFGVAWHLYGYAKGTASPLAVLAAGYPIVVTETYGFDNTLDGKKNANGYTWAASQGIGYLWWGWNDWSGQSWLTEVATAPWFESTAP